MTNLPEKETNRNLNTEEILPGLRPLHLQRLLMVSHSLGSTLDLPEILKMVLAAATELTESVGTSILLVEPNGIELRFVACSDISALENRLVPIDKSLAGWVVSQNKSVIIDDAQNDVRHHKESSLIGGIQIKNLMIVPLRDRGKVIGVLEAFNKKEGDYYTKYDQSVAQALAAQAAMSIVNARLFSQSDVIAETMHELKTPLMAMTAATEMLEMKNLSEAQRSHVLKTLKRETRRLTRMTQDFLTLSRLDSGRFQLDLTEVDPIELARSAMDTLEAQAENQGIKMSLVTASRTASPIMGDVSRLQQVLINLISNAIKFNRPNGKVAVKVVKREEKVWISVMDTGRGIDAVDIEQLFERFYRVSHGNEVAEGTGLGLSIAQKLMEAHDGRIKVESQLGKGSAFHCIFPIAVKSKEAPV
ncbi:MAG: signal transduction histidine kinase [Cellvibrionaceae bacterium]|jgi:signal transduction histidine kinase